MAEPVRYRLRTLGSSRFSQHDIYGGEWVGESHDDILAAAQEFIDRKGVGRYRVMRDEGGNPRAVLYRELQVINDYVSGTSDREVAKAKQRKAAA